MKTIGRYWVVVLLGILVLGGVLRIYHLSYKSISIDESIGAFYAMESFYRVIIVTINDVHPPFFYILHHFWIKLFGSGEAALRSISIFFGMLTILSIYKLGEYLFNRKVGLVASLLLAVLPWHIWLSQNARSNAFIMFLVVWSIYAFVHLIQTKEKRWYLAYIFITMILIYTHYFGFMVWFSQNLYVMFNNKVHRRLLKDWWLAQIFIVILYMPWIPFMISQIITKTRPMYKHLTLDFVKNLYDFMNPYVAINNETLFIIGEIFFGIIFLIALYYLNSHRKKYVLETFDNNTNLDSINRYFRGFLIFAVFFFFTFSYIIDERFLVSILEQEIEQNANIYANSIKEYHLDQIQSIKTSFFLAGIVGIVVLVVLLMYKRIISLIRHLIKPLNESYPLKISMLLIIHLVLPLLVAGLSSLKNNYMLLRSMSVVVPAYVLIFSSFIIVFHKKWQKILVLSCVLIFSALSFVQFEQWNRKNDWRTAAQVAKNEVKENEIILLDHMFGKKPFYYYGIDTQAPLRKYQAKEFFSKVDSVIWVLVSYENEWYACDSLDVYFNKEKVWHFSGTNSLDDLHPMDDELKLVKYKRNTTSYVNATLPKE